MKLLRSRKALSPVVASIILIAVTVAVSIAVAAWMGALSGMFMGGAEQVSIVDVRYNTSGYYVEIEVSNSGTDTVTISDIRIDGTSYTSFNGTTGTLNPPLPYDIPKGTKVTFKITWTQATWPFRSGTTYTFTVRTAKGNTASYPKIAPS